MKGAREGGEERRKRGAAQKQEGKGNSETGGKKMLSKIKRVGKSTLISLVCHFTYPE